MFSQQIKVDLQETPIAVVGLSLLPCKKDILLHCYLVLLQAITLIPSLPQAVIHWVLLLMYHPPICPLSLDFKNLKQNLRIKRSSINPSTLLSEIFVSPHNWQKSWKELHCCHISQEKYINIIFKNNLLSPFSCGTE